MLWVRNQKELPKEGTCGMEGVEKKESLYSWQECKLLQPLWETI